MPLDEHSTEHKFQDVFVALCRTFGADAYSIVGSMYQSGRPDLDITSTNGNATKCELKTYRGLVAPTREKILALLRGPQINVITRQLWGRNANCLIIAHIAHEPKMCCILSRQSISFDLWQNTAKTISQCEWGSRPYA